jgi:hypothetical protein
MNPPQRYLCLTCEALARPAYACAASSPHLVDVELLRRGLHNQPADLRTRLQERIAAAEGQGYHAVLFVYGLCGKALDGLAALSIPLVIPRAHDCITLFLGSRERYNQQFTGHPGTYWYTRDYIEREDGSSASLAMGAGSDNQFQGVYDEFVQKYGKDNADYLMEVMGAWQKHYDRAVYIDLGDESGSRTEEIARAEAVRRGWAFERMAGDLTLIRRLLHGAWDADFLVVPPGSQVCMSMNEEVITSREIPPSANSPA